MADEQDPRDGFPRAADDDVDPADLAFVADALADLTFLRPDEAPVEEAPTMPEWAWDRVAAGLTEESAHRHAESAQRTPTDTTSRGSRGPSRLVRWGGGLVAASLAVVAIGAGVTLTGGSDADVVAGEAPAASLVAQPAPAAEEGQAEADGAIAAGVLEAPQQLSFAGMVPPAQMLVDSQMNYTADSLASQVSSVLKRFGVDERAKNLSEPSPAVIESAPMPATGFTASEEALRDCITKLTRFAGSTALMVDRANFEGHDSGVVVAPSYAQSSPDMTRLQVWVVDPNCDVTMAIQISMAP